MSSKLFHTIVAVGITLGTAAAAMGCSSPAEQQGSDTAAESTSATDPSGSTTAQPADAGPGIDAFCDATWPTTKGGIHRHPPPACVDPTGACAHLGLPFDCAPVNADHVCGWDSTMAVCFEGSWQCKPGRMPSSSCSCNEGDSCDPAATPPATPPASN